jgi:hypothetical protein
MHSMAVITGRGSLNHKPASTYDCPVDIRRCLGVPWGADAGISKQAIGADALTSASTSTVLCSVECDTRAASGCAMSGSLPGASHGYAYCELPP